MKSLIIALRVFFLFTILTGVFYPLLITSISQVIFPFKANGSLICDNNGVIGSELIGQQFDSLKYFSSRPSKVNYNPMPSGASNYALTNANLILELKERYKSFISLNYLDSAALVPSEMLFSSASGLDPHISPEAAYLQVERICEARKFNADQKIKLKQLINNQTEAPQLLCLGEKRVNVILLNLMVDQIK
jgi:potassium-transporting ATPase KdpC subunit